ncbi:MAG: squalene/phytoene synthase family protein [Paracoccaceae bacterium]
MTVDACAALVQRGDPERFQSVMAAPLADRAALLVLYAWNLEVARAPWVAKEPMIAEMRLQWWRDVLEGPRRAHEVAGPLHDLIHEKGLPVDVMDRLVAARTWDIYRDAHADQASLNAYLEDTGAGLMWLCALATGASNQHESAIRAMGWATALVQYMKAVPELEARGRIPLVDGRNDGVRDLARGGLVQLNKAYAGRKGAPGAALLAGWQTRVLLTLAIQEPQRVADGALVLPEFTKRRLLLWQAMTGRF